MAGLEGMKLGSYEILQRIGSGGMAEVYRARQLTAFGREVAIKVVRAGYSEDPNFRERFLREAQAISKLSHPNILPLIEFGEQEEMLYLVMPLVREGTLRDLLHQRKGPLPLEEAIPFFIQLCNAVHYAHTQGIIHRDIKPQNMLLQQGTHLLLADFGIARDTANSRMTTMGVGIGTVEYMAPEQALGQFDIRSDIYSLGIVLYQLLTGQVPYTGSTPFQTLQQHSAAALPDPHTFNPTLPPEAIEVLRTALAKDPKDRFQTAQALGRAAQQLWPTGGYATSPIPAVLPPVANTPIPPITSPGSVLSGRQNQESPSEPGASPSFPSAPALPQGSTDQTPLSLDFYSLPTVVGKLTQDTDPATWNNAPNRDNSRNTPIPTSGPQPALPGGPVWSNSSPGVASGPYPPAPAGIVSPINGQSQVPVSPPGSAPRPRSVGLLGTIQRLSPWQRLLLGGLACLVIVGSVAAIVLAVHSSPPAQTHQIASTTQAITRYGAVNSATLGALATNPQNQITMAARLKTATPPGIPSHIQGLPDLPRTLAVVPVSTPSAYPGTLPAPQPIGGFTGLGQAQLGIDAPVDISVANNGSATIEVVDGAFVIGSAAGAKVISLTAFFQQLLGSGDELGEPRVFFDADLGKWILIANQLAITNNGEINGSSLDLAISKAASPLGNWDIYQFTTQAQAYGGCNWADFPQLGINAVGLFITATNFACGVGGSLYGASLWELPKQQLSSGTLQTISVVTGFATAQGDPVVTLTPAVEGGKDTVEWLLSNENGYVDGGQVSQHMTVWAVGGDLSSGTPATPTVLKTVLNLPYPYADPPSALQQGSAHPLATGDARIVEAQLINSHLFAAFTSALNWEQDPITRAGIYWVDLLPTLTNPAAPTRSKIQVSIFQVGFEGDPSYYFYSPSFVANSFGNAVLLAEVSGLTLDPHLILTSRIASDPLGTMGGAKQQYLFLPLPSGPYKGAHWGDYAGGYAAPVSSNGKSQFIWVAGPHVDSSTGTLGTNLWEIPNKSG